MTKKVVVLSETKPKQPYASDVRAVVTHALCRGDAELLANTLEVPLRDSNSEFCLGDSDRAVRFSPTKRVVGDARAVFLPLREEVVRGLDSPCARDTNPALYTAFILALSHGASVVVWYREHETQNPPAQSKAFQHACKMRGVTVTIQ